MSLYLTLMLGTVIVPFAVSFDRKLKFYKRWKVVLPVLFFVAAVYIAFDVWLTQIGVWGFNSRYHSDFLILNLPIEEWLFFIFVPYASMFLHYTYVAYHSKYRLSAKLARYISIGLIVVFGLILVFNTDKIYTTYILCTSLLVLVCSFWDQTGTMKYFYITFLFVLIPFVLVNATLTGSFTESEIVWYNDAENLGIRFLTIPIEDFAYAFSLVLFPILFINNIEKKLSKA